MCRAFALRQAGVPGSNPGGLIFAIKTAQLLPGFFKYFNLSEAKIEVADDISQRAPGGLINY